MSSKRNGERNAKGNDRLVNAALSKFSSLAPVWTLLAALYAVFNPSSAKRFAAPAVMQSALFALMFAMGMAILPEDVSGALSHPEILLTNAALCYGLVPLLGVGLCPLLRRAATAATGATAASFEAGPRVGLLLLASVGGGQASNLLTLLSGGDVALSVVCTLSTTLLGVLTTPLLTKLLVGRTVEVNVRGVLQSVASLVLVPLVAGLGLGERLPTTMHNLMLPYLPVLGILATTILVAGGASSLTWDHVPFEWVSIVLPSCLLCLSSGAAASWWIDFRNKKHRDGDRYLNQATKRALVIETMSKSPTLAYFLASKHFGTRAAAVPAAAMVTLAVLGALVASLWSTLSPCTDGGEGTV